MATIAHSDSDLLAPWLAHYDPGVPHTIVGSQPETLLDVVQRQAEAFPDRVALRFEGAVTTYRQLLSRASAFAAALETLGVRRGDRVALVIPNVPQFVVAELGAWMVGAIVTPINFTYPDDELAELLSRSGASMAVVLSLFYDRVKRIQPGTAVRRIIVCRVRDALPRHLSVMFRLFKEARDGHRITLRDGDAEMSRLLAGHAGQIPSLPRPQPGDTAVLLPSGGTTGVPKWVMGSHEGLVISGRQLHLWFRSALAEGDTLLLPLPLFHAYALGGVQTLAFTAGLSVTLVPNPRDTASVLRTIRRELPAFVCTVPALLTALMTHKDAAKSRDALRRIKLCFSGAAPLLAATRERFESLTGGVIVEGYSLTEAQMAVVANPVRGNRKTGSVGMPLPDVRVRIMDTETGTRAVAIGEPGEVLMSAPQLMQGYWGNPEETREMLRPDETGTMWLYTGDIGFLDAQGYLFLTDRKKELIKVSGFQVWPREVEEAVASHPAVQEVGVAPIQHEKRGEVPKAWVVLRAGATVTSEEIRSHCATKLAPYKVPAEIAFVSALPKTAVGKVLRRKLKELTS